MKLALLQYAKSFVRNNLRTCMKYLGKIMKPTYVFPQVVFSAKANNFSSF